MCVCVFVCVCVCVRAPVNRCMYVCARVCVPSAEKVGIACVVPMPRMPPTVPARTCCDPDDSVGPSRSQRGLLRVMKRLAQRICTFAGSHAVHLCCCMVQVGQDLCGSNALAFVHMHHQPRLFKQPDSLSHSSQSHVIQRKREQDGRHVGCAHQGVFRRQWNGC